MTSSVAMAEGVITLYKREMRIMEYLGTVAVIIVLAAIVIGIIMSIVKDKKKGKKSCGCNCGCCPNSSACHGNKK